MLAFACTLPLLETRITGRRTVGTIFTGPDELQRLGYRSLSLLVVLLVVVFPGYKLGALLLGRFAASEAPRHRLVPWLLGFWERLAPWAMVEVFLLGVFVAYTRIQALAHVEIGPALVAACALALVSIAVDATTDRASLWDRFAEEEAPGTAGSPPVACEACGRVASRPEGSRCPRCHHVLHARKPNAVGRAWAMLAAAVLLYLPANILPVMTVTRSGKGGPHTILGGVLELGKAHLYGLAALVFTASILVPVLKLVGLGAMLVFTRLRSSRYLVLRTRLFRFIASVGRWSMIDLFALSTLVAMVRMGRVASVLPGPGAVAFAGVVVVTMFATEFFDPRLMWDAVRTEEAT